MLQYKVTVRLADSNDHIVTGKIVTIPEIAVLRRVHGSDNAVTVTGPAEAVARSDNEERDRLRLLYDNPTPDSEALVDRLFGGPLTALPKRLIEIGIDPKAQAAALRAQAEQMATAALALGADLEPEADAPEDVDDMFGDEAEEAA